MPLQEILELLSEFAEDRDSDRSAFPEGVLPFWSTDDGNYFAEYVSGAMHGKELHLDHEELYLVPVFRSAERLLSTALSMRPEDELGSLSDYPVLERHSDVEAASDLEIANELLSGYPTDHDDDDATWEQAQHAMCSMAMLPPNATGVLFQLLRSRHVYVAEFACKQIVARRLDGSVSALTEIIETGTGGLVLMSALSGLSRLGGREAVDALIRLAPTISVGYAPYFGGFETWREGDEDVGGTLAGGTRWMYRIRDSEEWQPLPTSFPVRLAERLRSETLRQAAWGRREPDPDADDWSDV